MAALLKRGLAAGALAAALACGVPSSFAAGGATTLFSLKDRRLDEISGIARGIVSPGVFYVQNDSGDSARFFAIDARSGAVSAQYRVPGAQNVDWEDLAVAPDRQGTPSVWLADIGDNDARRDHVTVYRVDEPRVRDSAAPITTSRPDVWQLRYPTGAANAESFAVTPLGRPYLVTKRDDGRSVVYAVPTSPSATVQTLRQVARLRLPAPDPIVPPRLQRLATGAAFSRDGRLFVVRTYTAAYLWRVRDGDLAAALRRTPVRLAIPLQPQGEGVCFDGDRLVLDSEQVGSDVDAVPLPAAFTRPRTPSPTSSPTSSSTSPPAVTSPGASGSAPVTGSGNSDGPPLALRLGLGAAIAVGVVAVFVRRRRRRRG